MKTFITFIYLLLSLSIYASLPVSIDVYEFSHGDQMIEFYRSKTDLEKLKVDLKELDFEKIYEKADKLVKKLNYNKGSYEQRYTTIQFFDQNRKYGVIKVSYFKIKNEANKELADFILEVIFYPNGKMLPYKLFDKTTYKKKDRILIPHDAIKD